MASKGLGDIVPPYSRVVSTTPGKCFTLYDLNKCCNKFNFIPFSGGVGGVVANNLNLPEIGWYGGRGCHVLPKSA